MKPIMPQKQTETAVIKEAKNKAINLIEVVLTPMDLAKVSPPCKALNL